MQSSSPAAIGQGHESDTTPWPATRFASNTTFDRFVLAPGLDAWIYTYTETRGSRARGLSTGLEIAVHLSGHWLQRTTRSETRAYGAGEVHGISPGESFDLAFAAGPQQGIVVGFHIDPAQALGVDTPDAELLIEPRASASSALLDMAWSVVRARRDGETAPEQAASTIREHVVRHADLSSRDGLWRAKKVIDRHFLGELYLDHLADAASMHRRTFLRRFTRRFGTTPIQYRISQRLNHAGRLSWAQPDLTVAEIAQASGFSNRAYFHRAFLGSYGTTPDNYRRRRF